MTASDPKAGHVVGVDLGGTKIMAGVYSSGMEGVAYAKLRTKPHKGAEEVVKRIIRCINEALQLAGMQLSQVRAIGLGAPGPIDATRSKVLFAPNLGWKDFPLKARLEGLLQVPVFLENDCNACTLGIHAVELAGRPQHVAGIFIGTGIGGGLVLDGKLYSGFSKAAGEIGHMVLEVGGPVCGCGNRGCFEALASRTAIFSQIEAAVKGGEQTVLTELAGPELHGLRSASLRLAMAREDKLVMGIVTRVSRYIGIAAANVANLLNPEFIVLGGGVIEQLEDYMMGVIVETARDYAMPGTLDGVSIQPSKLADDAGIIGAGVLAFQLSS